MLVRLSDISEAELERYGPLPPAHKKRRRASVGLGSCFRLEALPPTAGDCPISQLVDSSSAAQGMQPSPGESCMSLHTCCKCQSLVWCLLLICMPPL